jgi:cell division protein FtsI (penicillin-binding protein 3)
MANNRISKIKIRTFFVGSLMVLFWTLIIAKFFFIQVINSDIYKNTCRLQSQDSIRIAPQRGNFYDRHNNLLTTNITLYDIGVNPAKNSQESGFLKFLGRHFPKNTEQYRYACSSSKSIIWVARDTIISKNIIDSLRFFPAAVLDKKTQRNYHLGASTGSLLGYVSGSTGIFGLEKSLDNYLSGRPGLQIIEKDGRGKARPLFSRPQRRAINGNRITLTIDQNYQNILYEEVERVFNKYKADNAKGIIIDPETGEILAMASCPSFDPNNRATVPRGALKNRVVSDIYEPGSTFKVVTATCALEKNAVQPEDTIDCEEGEITIQGRTIHDHEKYPAMTFREVIQHSSNVGSILAAQKAGKEHLFRYTTAFGFGNETNIALTNEEEGIVPPFHKWTALRTAQIAMGHGLSTTVLQLAYAYGVIANGGKLMKPILVKDIRTEDGRIIKHSHPRVRRTVASQETMQELRSILRDVVEDGTGIKAEIQGMSIAGKTGTAQKPTKNGYSNSEYVASFAGFFPASDPELVTVIVVDNPKGAIYYGGYVAAPAVREVFKRIVNASNDLFFDNMNNPKYANQPAKKEGNDRKVKNYTKLQKPDIVLSQSERIHSRHIASKKYTFEMPDVIGFPASRAIGALQRMGLKVKIKGSGKVVAQYPEKGRTVQPGNKCILKLQS